jgi:ribose-phosphate pyrophosphokinase
MPLPAAQPPLLYALPGNEAFAARLCATLDFDLGEIESRQFPDGETYLRLKTSPAARQVGLVCTLDRPDTKFLPLVFAAATAKRLGAASVGLVAPYLCYLRQDKEFHPGEAITSATFGQILSGSIDWLVTVAPHLHRYASLNEVYAIPSRVVAAAPLLAAWIAANVVDPILIGPDSESEQWVAEVARIADAHFQVLTKERLGDRQVRVSLPDATTLRARTPVLVDDIISSAQTMLEAARQLRSLGGPPPVCVAVHALFADDSYRSLKDLAASVVTADTVLHPSNQVGVAPSVAKAVRELCEQPKIQNSLPTRIDRRGGAGNSLERQQTKGVHHADE